MDLVFNRLALLGEDMPLEVLGPDFEEIWRREPTKENLRKGAEVSRSTMYRRRDVMENWRAAHGAVAPKPPAAMRERIRELEAEIRRNNEKRSFERQKLIRIQDVLVQRVQASTLALVEARGGSKVVSIGLLRRSRQTKDADAGDGHKDASSNSWKRW
jgi:hypothetical protein